MSQAQLQANSFVALSPQTPLSADQQLGEGGIGGRGPHSADRADAIDQIATGEVHACWNEIGVYGNGRCDELSKFVHCRNCPVYSTAGVRLLNRPLSAQYRRERTEHFAQSRQEAPSRSVGTAPARVSAVLFRLSNEWLALPTQAFQEVAERRLIHSLPHRRQGIVLGLVNVRGELLICVSLGRLLGVKDTRPLPPWPPSPNQIQPERGVWGERAAENIAPRETLIKTHARLLVVNWDANRLVFPVDEIHGIHRFQPEELKEAPATVAKSNPTYTQGVFLWRDRAIGFLDADSLFSSLNRSLT